jgi:hypothetical protein
MLIFIISHLTINDLNRIFNIPKVIRFTERAALKRNENERKKEDQRDVKQRARSTHLTLIVYGALILLLLSFSSNESRAAI